MSNKHNPSGKAFFVTHKDGSRMAAAFDLLFNKFDNGETLELLKQAVDDGANIELIDSSLVSARWNEEKAVQSNLFAVDSEGGHCD